MPELWGVLAAVLSSGLGGTAVGATRYLVGVVDPITIGAIRFAGGFLVLLPVALWRRERWPARSDWPGVAGLGLLFFGLFPVLFNASLIYTTAARGALALSTLPLLTMAAGALLRIEPLTVRKTLGVLIATAGVAVALGASLSVAPPGAWRGDLLMVAAAFCMALYSVWSRAFIARSAPLPFAAASMGVGAICLTLLSALNGGLAPLGRLHVIQWIANGYLAVVCGAFVFFLWAYALGRAAPTLVAVSVAVNPVTASLFGIFLLGETPSANLLLGLAAILLGIGIATGMRLRRVGESAS
jgi:drug/metabolite transporter (DMT)-like permease